MSTKFDTFRESVVKDVKKAKYKTKIAERRTSHHWKMTQNLLIDGFIKTTRERRKLTVLERKFLRRIFGPKKKK